MDDVTILYVLMALIIGGGFGWWLRVEGRERLALLLDRLGWGDAAGGR